MAIRKKAKAAEAPAAEESKTATVTTAKKAGARKTAPRQATVNTAPVADATAIQRGTRQSPYKMRLVIDQIRGKNVNEALGLLKFSKKHAAMQIAKTLSSAVANAEHAARQNNESLD